jgi:SPP1 gp7 family putative phage head morphogenesis protein
MAGRLVPPNGKRKILAPVRPNIGVEIAYRKRLDTEIAAMNRSVIYWVRAQYRSNPPIELAQDGDNPDVSPAMGLRGTFDDLGAQWRKRFDTMAEELGRHFAKSATQRADGAFQSILKKAGWSVKFRMTPAANQALQAGIGENIALIKSIPQQYLTQVQGIAMRSIQRGGDLGGMVKEIETQFGVTRKRAAFIAMDQNNKATAIITRVRQQELGIDTALWLHSAGGREPRVSHVKNDGKPYKIAEGWYDPDVKKRIWPGELPRCRCVGKPIVEGFS